MARRRRKRRRVLCPLLLHQSFHLMACPRPAARRSSAHFVLRCRSSVLFQVSKFNDFFWNTTKFPPQVKPVPEHWKPEDEHGEPLSENEAREEWIEACSVLAVPGGPFTCMDGIVANRWHLLGKIREVCACFSFLSSITPVHNSANSRYVQHHSWLHLSAHNVSFLYFLCLHAT